jgi:hypothetical protein
VEREREEKKTFLLPANVKEERAFFSSRPCGESMDMDPYLSFLPSPALLKEEILKSLTLFSHVY